MAEFAVVVWVYDIDSDGVLTINWGLTRKMAAEIAVAYRQPLEGIGNRAGRLRAKASDALRQFATQRCANTAEVARSRRQ